MVRKELTAKLLVPVQTSKLRPKRGSTLEQQLTKFKFKRVTKFSKLLAAPLADPLRVKVALMNAQTLIKINP